MRAIGAEQVIDYTKEDFTRRGERYDVIVDTAGTAPFSRCEGSLAERGRLLVVLGSLPEMLRAPWVSLTTRKKVIGGVASWGVEDLRFLGGGRPFRLPKPSSEPKGWRPELQHDAGSASPEAGGGSGDPGAGPRSSPRLDDCD